LICSIQPFIVYNRINVLCDGIKSINAKEYNEQSVESQPIFRRNISLPSSGLNKPSSIPAGKYAASLYGALPQKIILFVTSGVTRHSQAVQCSRLAQQCAGVLCSCGGD
jgi:hypothetical protein